MRLNRNTLIFAVLLLLVIAVAYIFQNTDAGLGANPTPMPTTTIQNLFPNVQATSVTALTINSRIEIGDTRPTPIPGNPPLATLTPLPEGVDAPTETKTLVLNYDAAGIWVLGQGSSETSTQPIMQQTVTTALTTLVGTRSSQSFIPANGDYAQYGLDNPSHDITFTVQAPATTDPTTGQAVAPAPETHRLRLGNRSVDNASFFAFLDADETTVYVLMGAGSLDSSVLRMVTQPPFTPAPTPTAAPVLNVQLPFVNFNYNLANSVTVVDHVNNSSITLYKLADGFSWGIELGDATVFEPQAAVTPEATAEMTAEATSEATAEATAEVTSEAIVETVPEVDQVRVAIYLTEFGNISGTSRTTVADLSTVGLDNPRYTMQALMGDGTVYTLRLGDNDPTNTVYYALVDNFTDVVLIEAGTVAPMLDLLFNPPYVVVAEVTPEATAEATAPAVEATEAAAEATAEATEAGN